MDKTEINQKMHYYGGLVDEFDQKRRKLEQQISELKALSGKFSTLSGDFSSKQSTRKSGLANILKKDSINAVKKYYSGMYDLLNGIEYTSVKNGIGIAKTTVDNKRNQLKNELANVNQQLSSYRSNLRYWQHQLKNYIEIDEQ